MINNCAIKEPLRTFSPLTHRRPRSVR